MYEKAIAPQITTALFWLSVAVFPLFGPVSHVRRRSATVPGGEAGKSLCLLNVEYELRLSGGSSVGPVAAARSKDPFAPTTRWIAPIDGAVQVGTGVADGPRFDPPRRLLK